MTFEQALSALKQGMKVAREGWNGKDMWLCLVPGDSWGLGSAVAYDYEHVDCSLLPFIGMRTAQNAFVPWLASHTDLLAGDWYEIILDKEEPK